MATIEVNDNSTRIEVGDPTEIVEAAAQGPSGAGDPNQLTVTSLREVDNAAAIAAGVLELDCYLGNIFTVSLDAEITSITFSRVPTDSYAMTLAFTADGTARAVTWPASVKWPSGTAPTMTDTLNEIDLIVLSTFDGGTTWYGIAAGQAIA